MKTLYEINLIKLLKFFLHLIINMSFIILFLLNGKFYPSYKEYLTTLEKPKMTMSFLHQNGKDNISKVNEWYIFLRMKKNYNLLILVKPLLSFLLLNIF